MRVGRVWREGEGTQGDSLSLDTGVNVIVGAKDTGKSGWLQTISFLLGDTDAPDDALGFVATKFDQATLELRVGAALLTVQRRWKEPGSKGKIFVNGRSVRASEFSDFILDELDIPRLQFPRGNPYSVASWAKLSWRMLFRHVYREERFWSDLADKQPDREQHACILLFLGIAEKLYPPELHVEIEKRKELANLVARRDQFDEVFLHAAKDILSPAPTEVPSSETIDAAVEQLRTAIDEARARREEVLRSFVFSQSPLIQIELGERRAVLTERRALTFERLRALQHRRNELMEYTTTVRHESERLARTTVATGIFKPLKVTRCPHCDQRVSAAHATPGECFVCHQVLPDATHGSGTGAERRVVFEIEQLAGEQAELGELVARFDKDVQAVTRDIRRLDSEVVELDVLLEPIRTAAAAILPPELALLDTRVGQLEERAAQLLRLRTVLEQRDSLSFQLDQLSAEVSALSGRVEVEGEVPYSELSDIMSQGINEYLDALKSGDRMRWQHEPIQFELRERGFKIRVGKTPWSSLGATSVGLVALGYQYALLRLAERTSCHYPGIAIIDFPMTLADSTSIADKENYLIEPFVQLAARQSVQVIVAGRAFTGLEGAHRQELTHVWMQGEFDPEESGPRT